MENKLYNVVFGAYNLQDKDLRKKKIKVEDNLNYESMTVVGTDVYDILEKISQLVLQKEKEYAKEKMGLFIESIECMNIIDLIK